MFAAKFHYIKTVSDTVVAQDNCLSSGVNILAGGRPLPPEMLAPSDLPPPEGSEFYDTFCLVAPQLQEIEKEVQLRLTRT